MSVPTIEEPSPGIEVATILKRSSALDPQPSQFCVDLTLAYKNANVFVTATRVIFT